MMDLCEGMFSGCAKKILGSYSLTYQGSEIDLTPPFRRVTMTDIVKEKTGLDFGSFTDPREAAKAVRALGLEVTGEPSVGELLYLCFDELVESTLRQPTFVYMYPVEVSPLAKRSPDNPDMTERFELFICGMEFANAFSELNDPIDQKERFKRQSELRRGMRGRHDGYRLHKRAGIRHAPYRRHRYRDRQTGHAFHRQREHTRRHILPDDETDLIGIWHGMTAPGLFNSHYDAGRARSISMDELLGKSGKLASHIRKLPLERGVQV